MTMTEAKSLFFLSYIITSSHGRVHACLSGLVSMVLQILLLLHIYKCICQSLSDVFCLLSFGSMCCGFASLWILTQLASSFALIVVFVLSCAFFCVDSEGACKKPRINQHNCNANNTTGPWHLWASMDPSCLSFHPSLHASFWPSFLPSFFLTPAAALICVAFCCVCCSHQCKDRECFFSTNTFFSMEQFTQSRGDTIRETYINTETNRLEGK